MTQDTVNHIIQPFLAAEEPTANKTRDTKLLKPLPIVNKFLLLLPILMCGCAHKVWYQPGKTPAQAYQDLTDCKREAKQTLDPHGTAGFMPLLREPDTAGYIKDAMRGKGYVPTPANAVTNATQYPRL